MGVVVMSSVSLRQQAKAGNPVAITQMMNYSLQPKGIIAKAELREGILKIALQSKMLPPKAKLAPILEKSFLSLSPDAIQTVSLFGLRWGSSRPLWSHTFKLVPPSDQALADLEDPANVNASTDQALLTFLQDLDEATLLSTGRALGLGPSLEWSERGQLEALTIMKVHQLLTLAATELSVQPERRLIQILLASRLIQLSCYSTEDLVTLCSTQHSSVSR